MRPLFDDLDELDFDGSLSEARLKREQRREESRRAIRRSDGPKHKRHFEDGDLESYGGYRSYENYEEFSSDDFDGYDESEFDRHAGIGQEH